VARTFDAMADRLQRTVTAQREFVANASHQLRTPLTGIKLRLESAREDAPTEDLRRQLRAAEQEADRLAGIVERLLVMARSVESGEAPAVSDLERVGRTACDRWSDRAEKAGGSLELELIGDGEGAIAAAAEDDLNQILDNLIDNALSYAPGPVRMEVGRRDGRALVVVEDRGPGIPEEERGRVLERFYRGTGTTPGGSGLGLAIVRDLAGRWDGEVAVLAGASGGTRIEVSFPAVGPA
jgi:signal transduction histidine kinase